MHHNEEKIVTLHYQEWYPLVLPAINTYEVSVLGSTLSALTIYGAIKQKKDFSYLVLQNLKVYRDITPNQLLS